MCEIGGQYVDVMIVVIDYVGVDQMLGDNVCIFFMIVYSLQEYCVDVEKVVEGEV